YAATDAWACVKIYNCLVELERTGDYEITKEEPIETTE
ncbi:MAG: 3'-5' exonuclease domain-containing protein 2, partial [Phocaeicola sp.]|nr:3'-5' exonuclease domain-containing protein 2 [Phocaeicola sp.]